MTFHEQVLGAEAAASNAESSLSNFVKSLTKGVVAWMQSCADYWAAAALYDSLRGLSDTELRRRGLSRDTLARDICQSCDRTSRG
jgi:hypothetical protein